MSLLSIIRLLVTRIDGGDVNNSYGGNSTASDSDESEDNPDKEWIAFDELEQRAKQVEQHTMQVPDDDRRDGPAYPDDLPDAIARNGRVILTGGEIHDWIQADDKSAIDLGDLR